MSEAYEALKQQATERAQAEASRVNGRGNQAELTPSEAPALIFQPLTFQELLARPAKQWLIGNIIGPGDLGMIFGDSGTGKTFLVIDLIMSAITGLSWARHFEVSEPLSVVYCTNEGLRAYPKTSEV